MNAKQGQTACSAAALAISVTLSMCCAADASAGLVSVGLLQPRVFAQGADRHTISGLLDQLTDTARHMGMSRHAHGSQRLDGRGVACVTSNASALALRSHTLHRRPLDPRQSLPVGIPLRPHLTDLPPPLRHS